MRALESPFERHMSGWILSFAYLMCPSVSVPKVLKKLSAICHIQIQWRVNRTFSKKNKKNMEFSYQNHSHWKNISKEKIRGHFFVVYVLIYPLSKFGGIRTNSLWVLAFCSVRFKWKNWFKKTALNLSIRQVTFTSGRNLKLSFLCQYLIFFNDFFFTLEISFGSLLY